MDDRELGDTELFMRFEACTLERRHWTHRAHVRIGWTYLQEHSLDEALVRMRRGIKGINASLGIEDAPAKGYNETTTHAFMHLLLATMRAYADVHPAPTATIFCDVHGHLLQPTVLRLFYSPARRLHPDAAAAFIAPDLAPLPEIR